MFVRRASPRPTFTRFTNKLKYKNVVLLWVSIMYTRSRRSYNVLCNIHTYRVVCMVNVNEFHNVCECEYNIFVEIFIVLDSPICNRFTTVRLYIFYTKIIDITADYRIKSTFSLCFFISDLNGNFIC